MVETRTNIRTSGNLGMSNNNNVAAGAGAAVAAVTGAGAVV